MGKKDAIQVVRRGGEQRIPVFEKHVDWYLLEYNGEQHGSCMSPIASHTTRDQAEKIDECWDTRSLAATRRLISLKRFRTAWTTNANVEV